MAIAMAIDFAANFFGVARLHMVEITQIGGFGATDSLRAEVSNSVQ